MSLWPLLCAPELKDLDSWVNTFGNIVYVLRLFPDVTASTWSFLGNKTWRNPFWVLKLVNIIVYQIISETFPVCLETRQIYFFTMAPHVTLQVPTCLCVWVRPVLLNYTEGIRCCVTIEGTATVFHYLIAAPRLCESQRAARHTHTGFSSWFVIDTNFELNYSKHSSLHINLKGCLVWWADVDKMFHIRQLPTLSLIHQT